MGNGQKYRHSTFLMQTTLLLSVFQRRQVVSDRLFLSDSFHAFYAYFVNA
ncbi:hypothetical protein [Fischerella major]|nr:hypothetical protein [Fischerella major]